MISIRLGSGPAARLLTLDGDKATVLSPVAFPPGSTLTACLFDEELKLGDFQVKVSRCRRVDDAFHVDGRVRNATREVKSVLPTCITPSSNAAPPE